MADFITQREYNAHLTHNFWSSRGFLKIGSIRSGSYLANKIIEEYNKQLENKGSRNFIKKANFLIENFYDKEVKPTLEENVADSDVFLVACLKDPTLEITSKMSEMLQLNNFEKIKEEIKKLDETRSLNDNYMELFLTIRALKENGAKHITLIIPYWPYSRGDVTTVFKREPISARFVADTFKTAGADAMIYFHGHSRQLKGYFSGMRVWAIDPFYFFVDEFKEFKDRKDVIVQSMDAGSAKFATIIAGMMNLPFGVNAKARSIKDKDKIEKIISVGDFEGIEIALMFDDIMSTGNTFIQGLKELNSKGIKKIYAGISHFMGEPEGIRNLNLAREKYGLEYVLITDSIPLKKEFRELEYIKEKSLAPMLAQVINRIHYERSVSEIFTR